MRRNARKHHFFIKFAYTINKFTSMKRQLLLTSMLLSSGFMFAQAPKIAPVKSSMKNVAVTYDKKVLKGDEILGQILKPQNPYTPKSYEFSIGYQIGTTVYDLQTNGSNRNGVLAFGDNSVSAVWTFGASAPAFAERGTGYNYMDPSQSWGTFSGTREEASVRTGWPSIGTSGSNELILSHNGVNTHVLSRNTKGGSSWDVDTDIPLTGTWPRLAVSGNNVHAISVGEESFGVSAPLFYHRSEDGGATWTVSDFIIPGTDSTSNYGFGGDGYAIDAEGNTVVIAIFESYNPSYIMKSTDNGNTWTKTVFLDPGLGIYGSQEAGSISDINSDGVADTISSTDNSGYVLLDQSGNAHVWFGLMRHLDDDPTADAGSSFFPGTNGLAYWRESNPSQIDTIAGALDTDGSGTLLDMYADQGNIPLYYQSLSSWPTAGIDVDGNLYLAYSAIMEELNDGNTVFQFYRHMYIKKSTDNGNTWSAPYYIQTQFEFGEYIFPMMARNVNDYIHLVCQSDGTPGLHVRGDEDPAESNQILYFQIPKELPADLGVESVNLESDFRVFPNPTSDFIQVQFNAANNTEATIQIVDVTGKTLMVKNTQLTQGESMHSLDVSGLASGVYAINLLVDGKTTTSKFVKN